MFLLNVTFWKTCYTTLDTLNCNIKALASDTAELTKLLNSIHVAGQKHDWISFSIILMGQKHILNSSQCITILHKNIVAITIFF